MGRGLGKLLAQKGANIVIVARDKQKLADALKYISVRPALTPPLVYPLKTLRPQQRTRNPSASTASAPT